MLVRARTRDPDPHCSCPRACSACVAITSAKPTSHDEVVALRATHRVVPVCPETAGGLPTPRRRAERQPDGTVRDEDGNDVTEWFGRGAAHAVQLAAATGARPCGAEGPLAVVRLPRDLRRVVQPNAGRRRRGHRGSTAPSGRRGRVRRRRSSRLSLSGRAGPPHGAARRAAHVHRVADEVDHVDPPLPLAVRAEAAALTGEDRVGPWTRSARPAGRRRGARPTSPRS